MPSTFTNNLGTELKSGAYFITTALPSNAFIGRKLVDDKAVAEGLYASHARKLLPVVRLPEDSQDIAWDFQELERRKFILRSRGAPTTIVDGGVGALIVASPPPTLWTITPAVGNGDGMFVIQTEDGTGGWVVTGDEPDSPVELHPLTPSKTQPPVYPPNQVFKFTLVR